MKTSSIARNITYSMLSQVFALLAPLMTAPYVARVFNAELIGEYSYALANSSYFVLIECLGLGLYGQLKIAADRDDIRKTSKLFYEIMILKVILMIVSIAVYSVIIIPNGSELQRALSSIMLINIIANGIDVTWFLNGLEEFKITAIRSIFIRIINIVAVFILINDFGDIYLYAFIMQVATLLGFVGVTPYVLKKVKWPGLKDLNIVKHLKPAGIYFVPGLVTTIFSSTDKTMLGVFSNVYEVGVYEQAHKISQICMNAISAIGNVLLPRAAYIYHNSKDETDTKNMIKNSVRIIMFVSLPVTFGITAIAEEFVPLFFGEGYDKSILLLMILCLNVFLTTLGNVCGQLCLIARNQQKKYNIAICISAVTNVLLNLVLINVCDSVGAAIASVVASLLIDILIIGMSNGIIKTKELFVLSYKYVLATVLMYIVIQFIMYMTSGTIGSIICHVIIGCIVYFVSLIALKDKMILDFIKKIRN